MIESDHSDTEEGDMDKLQLSSDSTDTTTKKRLCIEESEDEATDLLTKKRRNSFSKQLEMLKKDNTEIISDKNGIYEYDIKEEKRIIYPKNEQNIHEKVLFESNMENKEKQNESIKQENGDENILNKNGSTMDENLINVNIKTENKESENNSFGKPARNAMSTSEDEKIEEKDNEIVKKEVSKAIDRKKVNEEDGIEKEHIAKSRTVDTEVVDGLELSVECASDKEEPSSESEDEKDAKPRPRTIIIKAKPNESELECSSSGGEKSDSQEAIDTLKTKSEKKRGKKRGSRTSFSKLKASGSEDSQNNNSDEDYSPRRKKKMKKSPITKKPTRRSVESKRGRGGSARRNTYKKNTEYISNDEDADATSVEGINKTKTKDCMEEELSEKESSASKNESDNNSDDGRSMKGDRKKRRSDARPEDNKHIQMLKKYLSIAGVKVKSYNDIWADCKSNAARIRRLKELLEKNGISGRPTLEKCKRAREENEKMREVSELDTSNIISEGRITRARRNMDNSKKMTLPDTPLRYREARNTFKRIQTVVDSDSE